MHRDDLIKKGKFLRRLRNPFAEMVFAIVSVICQNTPTAVAHSCTSNSIAKYGPHLVSSTHRVPILTSRVMQWTYPVQPRPPLADFVSARILEHYGVSFPAEPRSRCSCLNQSEATFHSGRTAPRYPLNRRQKAPGPCPSQCTAIPSSRGMRVVVLRRACGMILRISFWNSLKRVEMARIRECRWKRMTLSW